MDTLLDVATVVHAAGHVSLWVFGTYPLSTTGYVALHALMYMRAATKVKDLGLFILRWVT